MPSLAEKLAKTYGISIMSGDQLPPVKRLSTGLFSLDYVFGGTSESHGIPLGRVVEFFGKEHAGKTALASWVLRAFQKQGRPAIYVDAENAADFQHMAKFGVDLSRLTVVGGGDSPIYGERVFSVLDQMAPQWQGGVAVIDSAAALVPESAADDDDYKGGQVAHLARLLSYGLKRLVGGGVIGKNELTLVFTNQVRSAIGTYVPTMVRPGGMALGFYDSVLIEIKAGEVSKISPHKQDDSIQADVQIPVMQVCHLYSRKNKTSRPFLTAETPLYIQTGFDPSHDLLEQAKRFGTINSRGRPSFNGQVFPDQESLLKALDADPQLFAALWQTVARRAFDELATV
jgi:protein RecA